MRRRILIIVLSATALAAVSAWTGVGISALSNTDMPLILSLSGFAIALAAAIFSFVAATQARTARRDMVRLVNSFEMRLKELMSRTNRENAGLAELNALVEKELRGLAELVGERSGDGGKSGETGHGQSSVIGRTNAWPCTGQGQGPMPVFAAWRNGRAHDVRPPAGRSVWCSCWFVGRQKPAAWQAGEMRSLACAWARAMPLQAASTTCLS